MEATMGQLQQPRFSTPQPPKLSDGALDDGQQTERVVHSVREDSQKGQKISKTFLRQDDVSTISKMNRKKKYLIATLERTMSEIDRLIQNKAEVKRVERQLTKINDLESEIIKAVDEVVTSINDDDLADEAIEQWEEVRAQVVQTEDKAESYISKTGTLEYKAVKLPSLELPKFSGKILDWASFYDAFQAAVGSNPRLSDVQKLTHLRGCLPGRALRCIEGYAVTNENYEKAIQDLNNRFGRKRLVVGELVKSIIALTPPDVTDLKALRYLHATLQTRLRSLE